MVVRQLKPVLGRDSRIQVAGIGGEMHRVRLFPFWASLCSADPRLRLAEPGRSLSDFDPSAVLQMQWHRR